MSRFSLGPKFSFLPFAMVSLVAVTALSGCLEHPLKPVELDKGQEEEDQLQLTVNKDVDILFVIDNSGSMGEEQANLGANFPAMIEILEAEDVEANYRIGITTTDHGNPWCQAGVTTPESGHLVLSSCKDRIGDFIFDADTNVQDLACNDICDLTADQLTILPTPTDEEPEPEQRLWLENIEGKKNIPEATPMADAFACFGPQGINGCGFESQLESMYLALTRAQTDTEESYGFLRASAILAIVFVTDEVDCSYNKDFAEIFESTGSKVFWSNPASAFPTSAVCWNAGVDCVGSDPSNYETCNAVNKDVNGNSGVDDADAVLHPMNRYIGLVRGIEEAKQALNAQQEVIVALIGGVATDGQPFYGDSITDPTFQESFGIGPGCQVANPLDPMNPVTAVPPVRLRDMTETFTPDNMFSICDDNYEPALEAIANKIRAQIQPACYTKCVKDTDAATAVVDPECTVEEDPPGGDSQDVIRLDECLRDANGYVIDPATNDYAMPAGDINVCYALLTDDSNSTPSTDDDMSPECSQDSFNLEFKIARRPGFPALGGTSISATCSLADFPDVTCPGIAG